MMRFNCIISRYLVLTDSDKNPASGGIFNSVQYSKCKVQIMNKYLDKLLFSEVFAFLGWLI